MTLRFALLIGIGLLAFPAWAQANPAEMMDASPAMPEINVLRQAVMDTAPSAPGQEPESPPRTKRARKAKTTGDSTAAHTDVPHTGRGQPALAAPEGVTGEGRGDLFITALAHAYATHPQLKAQEETLQATDETVSQAVSALRPSLGAGFSVGRVNTDREKGARAEVQTLTATQPVFVGGALSGIRGAKQRVDAGQAQLRALEQQVLFDAVAAYASVVNRQAVLQVNQNNVDLLNTQYLAARARFEAGEVTRTDLAQAQSRLATARAAERAALGALDVDRAAFRRVIGFDAPGQLGLPPAPTGLPESLEAAQEEATANEPSLSAAEALARASGSDVGMFKGALLPSVHLVGSMRDVENTIGGSQAVSNDSVTLNLTVPLYQSGAEWSRIRQARDLAQRARYMALDTKNAVIQAVTQAWENYVTARAVITSSEEAVRAARTAMNSIQQENRFGTRTLLDVLNTQQDMVNAQVSLVNARVAERQAAYRLLAAVGRLTAEDLHLPADIKDPDDHYERVKYKLIGF